MYIGACESSPDVSASFARSSSVSSPVLTLLLSTNASLHKILLPTWSLDISKLNIATGIFALVAAYAPMFKANADFPIAGLAAISISSEP